jgi:hypothetical protein
MTSDRIIAYLREFAIEMKLNNREVSEMVLNQTVDLIEDLRTELIECRDQYQRLWAKQHRQKTQVMCDPHDPCEMCKELAYYND